MSKMIAVTGKGGVGKTTLAALMVAGLIRQNRGPVLAVDADPNSCLDGALGVKVDQTVGGVREEAREIAGKGLATGMAKQALLELKIAESLVEGADFDLIAMGRPEGPGCYCFANNVLKATLQEIARNYPVVVIDNEAGLENVSRRIVAAVDLLVVVTDPSQRGMATVNRLWELTREMGVHYRQLAIIVNRTRNGFLSPFVHELKEKTGAEFLVILPEDEEIAALNEQGKDLLDVSADNPVLEKLQELLRSLPS
jgi:CO dehydrogenase maturation factor